MCPVYTKGDTVDFRKGGEIGKKERIDGGSVKRVVYCRIQPYPAIYDLDIAGFEIKYSLIAGY
jgi:hypothetical protein